MAEFGTRGLEQVIDVDAVDWAWSESTNGMNEGRSPELNAVANQKWRCPHTAPAVPISEHAALRECAVEDIGHCVQDEGAAVVCVIQSRGLLDLRVRGDSPKQLEVPVQRVD